MRVVMCVFLTQTAGGGGSVDMVRCWGEEQKETTVKTLLEAVIATNDDEQEEERSRRRVSQMGARPKPTILSHEGRAPVNKSLQRYLILS